MLRAPSHYLNRYWFLISKVKVFGCFFSFHLRVNIYFWNLLPHLSLANKWIKDVIHYPKAMYIISHSIHLCVFVFWHNACTVSKCIKSHFIFLIHIHLCAFAHAFLQLICHFVIESNANDDCCSNLIVTNKIICILFDYGYMFYLYKTIPATFEES